MTLTIAVTGTIRHEIALPAGEINDRALALLKDIATSISHINSTQKIIMTSLQDIKQAIAAQNEAITTEIEQVNAKLDELSAAGTDAERAEIVADLQASTARISGIIADAPAVEPPAEPA